MPVLNFYFASCAIKVTIQPPLFEIVTLIGNKMSQVQRMTVTTLQTVGVTPLPEEDKFKRKKAEPIGDGLFDRLDDVNFLLFWIIIILCFLTLSLCFSNLIIGFHRIVCELKRISNN